jgi:uncharacterized membrane protein (UPF0136 family)
MQMTSLQKIAASAAGLYGLVALIGGVIGFVKAGSLASLIAGGISGLVLIACSLLVPRKPGAALTVALVVSLALVGRFAPKLGGPDGPSALAIIMVLGGLAVLVASGVALARGRRAAGSSA